MSESNKLEKEIVKIFKKKGNNKMEINKIRITIIKTLSSFDIDFDKSVVEDVYVEVKKRAKVNPVGLAYAIARSTAVHIIRRRRINREKITKQLLLEEKENIKKGFYKRLKEEFVEAEGIILSSLSQTVQKTAKPRIDCLFLKVLDRRRIIKIQEDFYPDFNNNKIRKSISWARKKFLATDIISSELRQVLEQSAWSHKK